MPQQIQKTFQGFAKLTALFLAEVIRSRRTSIPRAAELSSRVISGLKDLTSESEVLRLLNDLEKDFEEIIALKQALHFGKEESDIKMYEHEIKEYAAELFQQDMVQSVTFLQDAAKPDASIQTLCLKYPNFCEFVLDASDRAAMTAAA